MSYVDTKIIECSRASSEQQKGNNMDNPALFTNKINTRKQTLTEWIKYNPAPKPIESVDDWEDYIQSLENSAGLEEDNPF